MENKNELEAQNEAHRQAREMQAIRTKFAEAIRTLATYAVEFNITKNNLRRSINMAIEDYSEYRLYVQSFKDEGHDENTAIQMANQQMSLKWQKTGHPIIKNG